MKVSVDVHDEGTFTTGTMSIEDGEKHVVGSREIRGATCAEVIPALAAFVALTLDADDATSVAAPRPAVPAPPPPCAPVEPPPPAPPERPRFRVALGVAAGLRTGTVGPIAPTLAVGVDVARLAPNGWGFGLRARVLGAYSFPLTAGLGYATLALGALSLEPCVLRRITDRFRFALCAVGEAGALFVQGRGLAEERDFVEPWGSLGLAIVGAWSPTDTLSVELGLGALAPLLRADISAAGARVFEVEPVGVAVTVAAHLPLP